MTVLSRLAPRIALLGLVAIAVVPVAESRLDGKSRLISIEPLPAMDAAVCDVPVSISRRQMAAFREEQQAAASVQKGVTRPETSADEAKRLEVAARSPLRTIQDRYALFSAVAVDAARNEVILQDENRYRVLVYDRTVSTPPTAEMTQPKRIIGGAKTRLELNSGVYVEPGTGNIYAVNNDTEDHLTVFDRRAQGDVAPSWKLHTPHGAFAIAVDEEADEMFLTIEHSNAVSVFPKRAKDDDAPTRLLQGDRTRLADPHGIALDPKTNLIFVSNFGSTATPRTDSGSGYGRKGGAIFYNRTGVDPGSKEYWPLDPGQMVAGSGRSLEPSITVYPKNASGDTAPVRVIQGPNTQLNWPSGVVIDSKHGELYVANDGGDSVLVFSVSASGDATPLRVLKGPRTLLKYPNGVFLDAVNDELWVANFGNHLATAYKRTASGDTAPVRIIRSAPLEASVPALANARIAYDSKREEILAANCVAHPQIAAFARLADGNAKPTRQIAGQKTLMARTMHSVVYDAVHDEIVVPNAFSHAILTFRGGADGEEAPIRIIQGSRTGFTMPDRLALDPVNNELFVPVGTGIGTTDTGGSEGDGWIHVFPRDAVGNLAPIRKLGPVAVSAEVVVDPVKDLLFVTGGGKLLIFNRTDSGSTKPKRVITGGPKSGTTGPGRVGGFIPGTGLFVATTAKFGRKKALDYGLVNYQDPAEAQSFVAAWNVEDSGDAPPRWTIAHNILKEVRGVALDPKNKTVIVVDKGLNAIVTYYFPEVFD